MSRSRELFTNFFERWNNLAFLEISIDKTILNYNSGAEKIFKYSRDEIIGKDFSILYLRDSKSMNYDYIFSAQKFEGEVLFCDKEGKEKWVFLFASFLSQKKEYILVAIDITDFKRLIKELEKKVDTLEKIKFAAKNGVWDWNLLTNEVYYDEVYYKMAGYDPGEFPPRLEEFKKRVHPDDINRVMKSAKMHIEGKTPRFEEEFRFKRKDGSWMWILGKGVIVERDIYEKPGRFIGIHIDITKLKDVENKLREKEEQYRRIFEVSQDIIFVTDSKTDKIVTINSTAYKLLGYTDEEFFNHKVTYFFRNPEDRIVLFKEVRKRNGQISNFEVEFRKKDGSTLVGLLSGRNVYDYKGNIIGFHGTIRDITNLKKIQMHLAHSQKMESLGLLAGGVAHDFNNLLTVINGYSEMILMNLKKGMPLYDNVSSILEAGKKAESLVKQLLAFSRKQESDFRVLELNEIISSLEKMLRRTIGEDIELKFYFSKNISYIKADKTQIEQILINLVVNARDALRALKEDKRKKYIIVETGETVFDEKTILDKPGAKPGRYVYFTVSDNGIGMDKKLQKKVFDPFFTTKEVGKGTGLGLSMVYGIVKQHGGYIYVYSEPLVGTMFKVYFPAIVPEQEMKEENKKIEINPYVRGNETILIVEDEEIVKNIELNILEMFGYNVYTAKNGKEALDFLKRHNDIKIDLIVTDMVMPEMNGKDFIEKALEFRDDFKVIFASGYTDSYFFDTNLLTRKNVKFIHKPFSVEDFLRIIRSVLDNK